MNQLTQQLVTAVTSTGILCVPGCPAKTPLRKNRRRYSTVLDALAAGFRPCKRCKPLSFGSERPDWLDRLLKTVEDSQSKRFTECEIESLGFVPAVIRDWFKQNHRITFQGYLRLRRMAVAIRQIQIDTAQPDLVRTFPRIRDRFEECFDLTEQVKTGEPILVNRIPTKLGPMICVAADEGVALLEFADRRMLETQIKRVSRLFKRPLVPGQHPLMVRMHKQLKSYYAGRRKTFGVPLMDAGTKFQESVWNELQKIPLGKTTTYQRLANRVGVSGGPRAVGRANGDNRFTIVIPCHRVVGSDGSLTGYGGGLWRKRWLLDHEHAKIHS